MPEAVEKPKYVQFGHQF